MTITDGIVKERQRIEKSLPKIKRDAEFSSKEELMSALSALSALSINLGVVVVTNKSDKHVIFGTQPLENNDGYYLERLKCLEAGARVSYGDNIVVYKT